jgi:hypothetical protein
VERDEALELVMAYWAGHKNSNLTEKDYEDLDKALDVLTIKHTMLTFEFASGSISSSFQSQSKASGGRDRNSPIKSSKHYR